MKDGKIVETGTHEQLLKKGGFYSDIYNSQFRREPPAGESAGPAEKSAEKLAIDNILS